MGSDILSMKTFTPCISILMSELNGCASKVNEYVNPEHPKKLEQIERDKLSRLKDSLPSLLHLMRPHKETLVKTSVGLEAIQSFRRSAIDELKRNDTLLVIGGSADRFYDVMGEIYGEIEDKRIKKKIDFLESSGTDFYKFDSVVITKINI